MPFPLIKLGYLAVKQLSKPLANAIKQKAKTTPFFRNYILLPPAQMYHKFETTIKMRMLGLGKVSEVKPLSEAMAVDLAAEMLGEGVIFLIASGTLLLEWMRQVRKDQAKEDVQNRRLMALEDDLRQLGLQVERQSATIREMTRAVHGAGISVQHVKPDETGSELPSTIVDSSSKTILKVKVGSHKT